MRHACLGPKSCNSTGMNAHGMIHLEALGSSPGLLDQEVFVTTICHLLARCRVWLSDHYISHHFLINIHLSPVKIPIRTLIVPIQIHTV